MKVRYNHDRPLEDFEESLKIIRDAGYNPIAVTQMLFEDTFVFETSEEAKKAYKELEDIEYSKAVGWWYGLDDFIDTVKDYETENNGWSKVRIYWL